MHQAYKISDTVTNAQIIYVYIKCICNADITANRAPCHMYTIYMNYIGVLEWPMNQKEETHTKKCTQTSQLH